LDTVEQTALHPEVAVPERAQELKEIRTEVLRLGLPALVRNIFQTALGVVNVAVVGHVGREALAAVGMANLLVEFFTMLFFAMGIGATALVSRHLGAREQDGANLVARQAVVLATVLSLLISLLLFLFPDRAIGFLMMMDSDPDPEVLRLGTMFLRLVTTTFPLFFVMTVINSISQGAGDMKTPMLITGFINIVNGGLCYLLVYGKWGFPAMGVAGAAYAALIARAVGGILALWVMFSGIIPVRLKVGDDYRPHLPTLRRLLNVGVPAMVEQGIMQSSKIIYTMFVAGMGTIAIGANSIAMTSQSMSFMPGNGFAMAATALVGRNLGARRPDRAAASGTEANRMAMLFMGAMGLIFFFFSRQVVSFFTTDPEVIDLAARCLQIVAISQPATAASMVFAGSLRGAGDTRYVMVNTFIGTYGVRLLFSYIIGVYLGVGLTGVWVAMAADVILRSGLNYNRFRRGRWKELRV